MNNSTVFYKKDDDGNFIPIAQYDPEFMDSLGYGHYLITVRPGFRSSRKILNPNYAVILAGLFKFREKLTHELCQNASVLKSINKHDKELNEALENLNKISKKMHQLISPSYQEIVDNAIDSLAEDLLRIAKDENVEHEFKTFLVSCSLVGAKFQERVAKE